MFYRYTRSGSRIAVDLDGLYEGAGVFILGGSPELGGDLPLLSERRGIITLGVNNVPLVFTPDLWVAADKPPCFSRHIYDSPEILKLMPISRRDELVGDRKVRTYPATLFFGLDEKQREEGFCAPARDLAWYRSVFPMALQVAVRLGFARIYLVGFSFGAAGPGYPWAAKLTPQQDAYSQRTYDNDVDRLRRLAPILSGAGVSLFSCTRESNANGIIPSMPLADALATERAVDPTPSEELRHSSTMRTA